MPDPSDRTPLGSRTVTTLARLLLLLYPPSFRREMGAELVEDVGRRVAESAATGSRVGYALWLLRLTGSLLLNAPAAWLEGLMPSRRRARRRRARRERILGGGPSPLGDGIGRGASRLSWLDFKLGLRMLIKHPVLTLAGGFGIAVAIAVSAGFFAFFYSWAYPDIPLDEGDRIVGIEKLDPASGRRDARALHDFAVWREEMRSVEDVSAFATAYRNLITGDASPEPIVIAEMTPSGFALARVPPLMGRTLVEADAEPGAADVLVIGYDAWRARFAADPDIVGRDVRLGRDPHTIVGVMPEGFAFPLNDSYWTAFRHDPTEYPRDGGPVIHVFGQLAAGYELEDAQAELAVIGDRLSAEFGDTRENLRSRVRPYHAMFTANVVVGDDVVWVLTVLNSVTTLLLLVIGLNVAVLVYARTATRRGEITVRTALGASRRRIVGQLFAESLVLSAGAAAIGIGLITVGLRIGNRFQALEMGGLTPFWFEPKIPGPALVYAVVLAVLAAAVTGVIPGLQATSKRVQQNLRDYHSGTGLALGRTWTAMIVLQVAVTVAVLPSGVAQGWNEVARLTSTPNYPVEQYLVTYISTDEEGLPEESPEEARAARTVELAGIRSELVRRMEAEPTVVQHTPVVGAPNRGPAWRVTVAGAPSAGSGDQPIRARTDPVHPDFFEALGMELLAGRLLLPSDLEEGAADVVVVDRRFVGQVLGGGDPLGRRVAFEGTKPLPPEGTERWYEIVGVVENLHGSRGDDDLVTPVAYAPISVDDVPYLFSMFRVAGADPTGLSGRVREIAAELDPTLRVVTIPATDFYRMEDLTVAITALLVGAGVAAVLLLSAAGIYALMSVTVSQRRREIGIRTALGAQRVRLLGGIFGRALGQLAAGVGMGVGVAVLWDWGAGGEALQGRGLVLLGGMVVVIVGVGLVAAIGPARRGLGVEVVEVLGEG